MTREQLKALGLTDDQIERVMVAHGESTNSLRAEIDKVKEVLSAKETETTSLQEQLKERDTQLEALGGQTGENEDLKATIDALKQANEDQKKAHQKALADSKLNFGIEKALYQSGAKNNKAVLACIDKDLVKLGEDGSVLGLEEQLKNLKESDAYLFDVDGQSQQSNDGQQQGDTKPNNQYSGSNQKGNDGQEPSPEELGKSLANNLFGGNKE